jgi:hypothetical protein
VTLRSVRALGVGTARRAAAYSTSFAA